jgi:hypothetical protein
MGRLITARTDPVLISDTHTTAASRGFSGFRPETEQKTRIVSVTENRTLATLVRAFEKFSEYTSDRATDDTIRTKTYDAPTTMYRYALDLLDGVRYSAKDIGNFCFELVRFQRSEGFPDYAGLYLSALVEKGADENCTLRLDHLERKISIIGFMNRKNVEVRGNISWFLGESMSEGIVMLDGTAQMVGCKQSGGIIIINGNAFGLVGEKMKGGEIHINGDECRPGQVLHGKIFHNGKLIVDK